MPIFDQGYQHWSGELAGHAWRWLAITRHGVRIGMGGKILRLLVILSWIPAAMLAAVLCFWGLVEQKSPLIATFMPILQMFNPAILADPKAYRVEIWTIAYSYFLDTELWFAMVLILMVGPNLISRDLRYNALPLYFSRPLRRIDYFFGKLGVIVAFLGMVIIVPSLVAYILGLLFSLDLSIVGDTIGILLGVIAYGMAIAVSAGTLVLALSCLSRNSRYVALMWLGVWFISSLTSGVLQMIDAGQRMQSRYMAMDQNAYYDFLEEEREASKTNWRPLVSYTENLARVGAHLLQTDAAWEGISRILPQQQRMALLASSTGPQHPWYWSAAVLAGLFGLSVCILNLSIKSLDRLR